MTEWILVRHPGDGRSIAVGAYALAALALAGCRSDRDARPTVHVACTTDGRSDPTTAPVSRRGTAGALEFTLVSTSPRPPARGDNTWLVELREVSAGGAALPPLSGATLEVSPFMPDHGHGSPVKVVVSPTAIAGQYQLAPINLWMPGYWETTIHATIGAVSDVAVFRFCIAN